MSPYRQTIIFVDLIQQNEELPVYPTHKIKATLWIGNSHSFSVNTLEKAGREIKKLDMNKKFGHVLVTKKTAETDLPSLLDSNGGGGET